MHSQLNFAEQSNTIWYSCSYDKSRGNCTMGDKSCYQI